MLQNNSLKEKKFESKEILLINTIPSSLGEGEEKTNVPAGLLAIGTWITKNSDFNVKLIDCLVEKNYLDKIKEEINKGDIFLVGLSVMTFCIPNALEITRLIKKMNPEIKIIWGGVHIRLYSEQTIKHPLIDFIAYNEGEKPMLNLAKCLASGKSYRNVKGIMYKQNGKIIKTPPEDFLDLNELGVLNYDLLNPEVFEGRLISILTSRGCPHRCTFCINFITKNSRWRYLTPENVVREIELLNKKYGVKVIMFSDECFFVNKERAEKILDILIEKNFDVSFSGNLRADYFLKGLVTKEILDKMKKCGFFNVGISPEFGSQKMRDFIKKDVTNKDIFTAVKMIKDAGLGASYGFMTGFPTETKQDTLATVEMAKKIYNLNKGITVVKKGNKIYTWREKSRISGPEIYRPYPGGELYDYLVKKYNWSSPETLEGWEKYFQENTRYRIEDYPWLELKPEYYAALQLYVKAGRLDFPTFFKRMTLPYPLKWKIISALFYPFAKIRMSINFFDFPFEYIIGEKLGLMKVFVG